MANAPVVVTLCNKKGPFCYRKPVTDDVNWPLYTKDQPQYFIFNADKSGIGKGPRATACAFWNDFLPKLRDNSGK